MLRGQPETGSNYSLTPGLATWPGTSVRTASQNNNRPARFPVGHLQYRMISRYRKERHEVGDVAHLSGSPMNIGTQQQVGRERRSAVPVTAQGTAHPATATTVADSRAQPHLRCNSRLPVGRSAKLPALSRTHSFDDQVLHSLRRRRLLRDSRRRRAPQARLQPLWSRSL